MKNLHSGSLIRLDNRFDHDDAPLFNVVGTSVVLARMRRNDVAVVLFRGAGHIDHCYVIICRDTLCRVWHDAVVSIG